ncbi:MAG TPA: hypothetical protein VIX41_11090, partial [Acidimicrobiales bacterium]
VVGGTDPLTELWDGRIYTTAVRPWVGTETVFSETFEGDVLSHDWVVPQWDTTGTPALDRPELAAGRALASNSGAVGAGARFDVPFTRPAVPPDDPGVGAYFEAGVAYLGNTGRIELLLCLDATTIESRVAFLESVGTTLTVGWGTYSYVGTAPVFTVEMSEVVPIPTVPFVVRAECDPAGVHRLFIEGAVVAEMTDPALPPGAYVGFRLSFADTDQGSPQLDAVGGGAFPVPPSPPTPDPTPIVRFLADEYVSGTGYVDMQGRVWTLSADDAIQPTQQLYNIWWPRTYLELKTGPPPPDDDWCDWVDIYLELRNGLPSWSCCVENCVVPYYRQFHDARIVEGPTVLSHPKMHTRGSMMEIEFTIVAADPAEYGLPERVALLQTGGVGAEPTDTIVTDSVELLADSRGRWLSTALPLVHVRANGSAAGTVFVELVNGAGVVESACTLDGIASGTTLQINMTTHAITAIAADGSSSTYWGRDWIGPPRGFDISRGGPYTLRVSQVVGAEVPLTADVLSFPVSSR